jgi:toxin ParE1/3/4
MSSFRLRESAEQDLFEIGLKSREIAGESQMRRYLSKLDHAFHILAEAPELGQQCEHIQKGYRRLPHGSHVIFYRVTPDGIVDVIRILHERMLPDRHLTADEDEDE